MIPYGFTPEIAEEGWRLLMATSDSRLSMPRYAATDPSLFQRLDVWENHWFPLARVVVERHHPEVAEQLFLNLTQTQGVEVAVSVGTFVRRVREMQRGGTESEQAAVALLGQRGLNDAALTEAEGLLAQVQTAAQPEVVTDEPADREAAEEAMWGWYLEWSMVARTAIRNGNLLRGLGFRHRRSDGAESDSEPDDVVYELEPDEPATMESEVA
jgi:hypothetical protein